jgi:hypothetical protein
MITSKLADEPLYTGPSQAAINRATSPQAATSNKKAGAADKDPAQSVIVDKRHFELFQSLPAYSKINSVAATVRGADAVMQKIEIQIDQMKDQLLEHVKQYPPYDKASAERIRLLKQFIGFRKQIDQLTFPPDNYGAMKIMADPSRTSDAGDWEIELDNNDGNQTTIHSQQVHSGPEGLNIHKLPDEASDDEIYDAIENLDSAKEILSQRRNALSVDFRNILDQTHLRE